MRGLAGRMRKGHVDDRRNELANERIGRLLIRYATPAMFAMFVTATYNLVDTIFVGHGAGTLALAGLAISFPIQMIVLAVGMTIGIGSASVISRSLGAGDQRRAERTAGTSFVVTGLIAAALSISGIVFIEPLLRAFGASEDVLPYAADYLGIILFGSIVFAISVSSNNVARAEGNVKIAMRSMVIGAVVNTVLDPVFIFGLDMGIRGAAVATVIANVCTFVYLVLYFTSGASMLRIGLRDLVPDWRVLPEVFQVGASSFFQMVAGSLMAIPMNHAILIYGTDIHLAVLGVGNRAMMFFFMPIFGLVQGMQPIVGFNYGARQYARVLEATRKALLYATLLSTLAFVVLMFGTRPVLRLFSSDPALIHEGVSIIRVIIIAMPLVGVHMVGTALFQSLGKAAPALVLALARQVLLLLPLILVLPGFFGIRGLWMAFPIADSTAILLTGAWVWRELSRLPQTAAAPGVSEELAAAEVPTR